MCLSYKAVDLVLKKMIDETADQIEEKANILGARIEVDDKTLWLIGYLDFIREELEERIEKYTKQNIKFEVKQ